MSAVTDRPAAAAAGRRRLPRTVALLGSGEFEPWAETVDRRVLSAARPGSVAVVPTASWPDGQERFAAWGRKGVEHYQRLGWKARVVPLRTREDAFDPGLADAIAGTSLIFFSGGRPSYLAEVLAATPFWRALLRELDAGTAYGGCSAGACVLGERAPDDVGKAVRARLGAGSPAPPRRRDHAALGRARRARAARAFHAPGRLDRPIGLSARTEG